MQTLIAADDISPLLDEQPPAGRLEIFIEDVAADAIRVAPCLSDLDRLVPDPVALERVQGQVRAVLRAAVLRRVEANSAGSTVVTRTQTVGPWSESEQAAQTQQAKGLLWPSEISSLQGICRDISGGIAGRAFAVDTATSDAANGHLPWCSIAWGDWCSCGAYLTVGRVPLWEGGLIS